MKLAELMDFVKKNYPDFDDSWMPKITECVEVGKIRDKAKFEQFMYDHTNFLSF